MDGLVICTFCKARAWFEISPHNGVSELTCDEATHIGYVTAGLMNKPGAMPIRIEAVKWNSSP